MKIYKFKKLISLLSYRFQPRGHQLCKLLGIKDSFNMCKEFNSHGIFFFAHKHGRRFIVLYTNMAAVTSCENVLYKMLRDVTQ